MLAVEAAEHVVFGRPLHVVTDEQVEQSVAVVVKPNGGCAESFAFAEAGGNGYVDESALAGVPKKAILTDASDQDVRESIVVVVSDGDAHAVEFDVEAGARRHIGEMCRSRCCGRGEALCGSSCDRASRRR